MSNGGETDTAISTRGTIDRGTVSHRIPIWRLDPGVHESKGEVENSKRTPGRIVAVARNRYGGTWAWLVYNFAVNEWKLKNGHENCLGRIVSEIKRYSEIYVRNKPNIFLSGHASPSGLESRNKDLGEKRAEQVRLYLMRSGRIPADRFRISTSNLYSVVRGRPDTPEKRNLCRSVHIYLRYMRGGQTPDKFPDERRRRARNQIRHRFGKYEEAFYYWLLDNWNHISKSKYCWENRKLSDGLFFKPPRYRLRNDRQVWIYLKSLYVNFKFAHRRLRTYVGIPGGMLRTPPVLGYQQLARWIALDGHADKGLYRWTHAIRLRKRGWSDTATFRLYQNSFNQLICWINGGKYGPADKVWRQIEDYWRSQYRKGRGIPMRIPRRPQ